MELVSKQRHQGEMPPQRLGRSARCGREQWSKEINDLARILVSTSKLEVETNLQDEQEALRVLTVVTRFSRRARSV